MSQADFGNLNPGVESGTNLATHLNAKRDAEETQHLGASRPSYVKDGMIWVKDVSATVREVNYYDGATDVILGVINPTAHSWTPYIVGASPGALAAANSISDIPANITFSGVITPPALTVDTHNYTTTGLSTASIVRLSSDANRSITGITGGASGRMLIIFNVGAFDLRFNDQNSSSVSGNQFLFGTDLVLKPNQVIELEYDNTSTKWRPVATPSQLVVVLSAPQISANQNDYNPTGLSNATVLRLTTDASRNLTGLATGGYGRTLTMLNVGSQDLVLQHENTGSIAANRFSFPDSADQTMKPNGSAILYYDITNTRWRAASIVGGTPSNEVTFIGKFTASNAAALTISTGINSVYDYYEIQFDGLFENGNNTGTIRLEYSYNGGANWVALGLKMLGSDVSAIPDIDHFYVNQGTGSSTTSGPGPADITGIHLGTVSASRPYGVRGTVKFNYPSDATMFPRFDVDSSHRAFGGQFHWTKGVGGDGTARICNQVRFKSGANITGEAYLYGWKKH